MGWWWIGGKGRDWGFAEEGKTDDKVGDDEGEGAIETVGAFFDEGHAVFDEGRDVGYGHETHEGGAEELVGMEILVVLF